MSRFYCPLCYDDEELVEFYIRLDLSAHMYVEHTEHEKHKYILYGVGNNGNAIKTIKVKKCNNCDCAPSSNCHYSIGGGMVKCRNTEQSCGIFREFAI